MSQPCTTLKCKRTSRALCDCCKQNLCLQHLNEHNAVLLSKLNSLTDDINTIGDRLQSFKLDEIMSDARQKLKQWQKDCHEKIDRLFEKKYQELDRLATEQINQQKEKILNLQSKMSKHIRAQEATQHDIDTLILSIRQLEKEMKKIEHTYFQINTRSLVIDDSFIEITRKDEHELDLSTLASAYQTLGSPIGSYTVLTSSDQFLLIHQKPNLCLVDREMNVKKQVLWEHKKISDMCWSSTLDRFIVIADTTIFLVNEKTMSIENIKIIKQKLRSCVCFETFLLLSTDTWGSSIIELRLAPSIDVTKEWKPPMTCTENEFIDGIAYSGETCAILIRNDIDKSMRMELRFRSTLDRIWSCPMDGISNPNFVYHCCSLTCDEWLVTDNENKRVLHIAKYGTVKATISYNEVPYCAKLFGSNMLAVSTEKGVNFHEV